MRLAEEARDLPKCADVLYQVNSFTKLKAVFNLRNKKCFMCTNNA